MSDNFILNNEECQMSSCYTCASCSSEHKKMRDLNYPHLECFSGISCLHCKMAISMTKGFYMVSREDKSFVFCNEVCYKNYLITINRYQDRKEVDRFGLMEFDDEV